MAPEKADAAYLCDMLHAAREIVQFTSPHHYESYIASRVTQLAVERAIEIIGEAARHVSRTFQSAHPQIPWSKIIKQRHVIAHEYGEIKHELIWHVVSVRIPELIAMLEPLVPPPPEDPPH